MKNTKKEITEGCVFTDTLKGQKVPDGFRIIAVAGKKSVVDSSHRVGFVVRIRKDGKVVAMYQPFLEVGIDQVKGACCIGSSKEDAIRQVVTSVRANINPPPKTMIFLEKI